MNSKLLAISLFCVSACESSYNQKSHSRFLEAWNLVNNPQNFGSYETKFEKLPLEGNLTKAGWTDSYWPTYQGGIAHRWNSETANDFRYESPTKEQVRGMKLAEIAALSPAEKFDIIMGEFEYPTVKSEWKRTHESAETWEGLCHGWAPAVLHFDEPKAVLVTSRDGIPVPMGSSDIKALLTYVDARLNPSPVRWIGTRCNTDLQAHPESRNSNACKDTNSGSFHVVISNEIGINKKGFVADIERGFQVWNQPITGYQARVLQEKKPSPTAASSAVKELDMEVRIDYTIESSAQWEAADPTSSFFTSSETYLYSIELDANGRIVGGEWESENRPDFLWMKEPPKFRGYFAKVKEIYDASIAATESLPEPTVTE
jgi:hypothetical protein